ncbi:MAG: GntR family transcriptional regulator [Anaerolineae bacterium]
MAESDPDAKEPRNVLSRVALSEQIKEFIVERILDGEWKPGQQVVESALARELGVSQAPVREAVRDLTLLGFLKTQPYKGTFVHSFSAEELYEVYTVRAALEALAARTAAGRMTAESAQRLREILDRMIEAARRGDGNEMARLDNKFHETIMLISGNKLLHQLWSTLRFGYWTIATTRISGMDLEYLATRHEELLQALAGGDPDEAAGAMQRHIEELGKPPETDV